MSRVNEVETPVKNRTVCEHRRMTGNIPNSLMQDKCDQAHCCGIIAEDMYRESGGFEEAEGPQRLVMPRHETRLEERDRLGLIGQHVALCETDGVCGACPWHSEALE